MAVCVALSMAHALERVDNSLINKNVQRTIDLNSQLVKIGGTITIENTGEGSVSSYLLTIDEPEPNAFSSVTVQDSQKNALKIQQVQVESTGISQV